MTQAGVTALEPGVPTMDRWTVRRLREPGRVCQQMSPAWAWSAQSSLAGPQSPDSGGPSSSHTKPRTPSKWWMLWAGRALNSHPVSTWPSAKFPPPASFPRAAPPMDHRALSVAALQGLPFVYKRVKGEKVLRHVLGFLFWHMPP